MGSNGCEGHCSLPPKISSYFRRPSTAVNAVRLFGLVILVLFILHNFHLGFPPRKRVYINVYMREDLVTLIKASLEAGPREPNGEPPCQLTPPTWFGGHLPGPRSPHRHFILPTMVRELWDLEAIFSSIFWAFVTVLWIYDGVTQGAAAEVTIAWVSLPEASGDGGKMRMLGLPGCPRTRLDGEEFWRVVLVLLITVLFCLKPAFNHGKCNRGMIQQVALRYIFKVK